MQSYATYTWPWQNPNSCWSPPWLRQAAAYPQSQPHPQTSYASFVDHHHITMLHNNTNPPWSYDAYGDYYHAYHTHDDSRVLLSAQQPPVTYASPPSWSAGPTPTLPSPPSTSLDISRNSSPPSPDYTSDLAAIYAQLVSLSADMGYIKSCLGIDQRLDDPTTATQPSSALHVLPQSHASAVAEEKELLSQIPLPKDLKTETIQNASLPQNNIQQMRDEDRKWKPKTQPNKDGVVSASSAVALKVLSEKNEYQTLVVDDRGPASKFGICRRMGLPLLGNSDTLHGEASDTIPHFKGLFLEQKEKSWKSWKSSEGYSKLHVSITLALNYSDLRVAWPVFDPGGGISPRVPP